MRVARDVETVVANHLLCSLVYHRVDQDLVAVVLTRGSGLTRRSGRRMFVLGTSLVRGRSTVVTPLTSSLLTVLTSVMEVDWGGSSMVHC